MPGDDRLKDFEPVATRAARHRHGDNYWRPGHLVLLALVYDLFFGAKSGLCSQELREHAVIHRATGGCQVGQRALVVIREPRKVRARIWSLADEPGGESDVVPELEGWTERVRKSLVRMRSTDDAIVVGGNTCTTPALVDVREKVGWQEAEILPGRVRDRRARKRRRPVFNQSPQRFHAGAQLGVQLIEDLPVTRQHAESAVDRGHQGLLTKKRRQDSLDLGLRNPGTGGVRAGRW